MTDRGNGYRGRANDDGQPGLRRGSDISERLLQLAVEALRIAARLPKDPSGRHVGGQLVRAATGAGANYEEARSAESRGDFVHKVGVAAKEARETVFWLSVIQRSDWSAGDLVPSVRVAMELAAILAASARTARSRAEKAEPRRT